MICSSLRAAFGLLAFHAAAARADVPAPYTITASVALGAPDRWDYVAADPASSRVYAAHGDRFTVIDTQSLTVVGDVMVGPGAHGVAIVAALHHGFAASGETAHVIVFDLRTLATIAVIPVGEYADTVIADPADGRVWVIESDSGRIDAIDPATNTVTATLDVGGKLEAAAVDGQGRLFVNGAERREITVIDTRRAAVIARWPVPDCVSPHGIAYDAPSARLFTSCVDGQLFALDAHDGRIAARVPIGKGSDAVAVDISARTVLSANGDGSLSVLRIGADDALTAEPDVSTPPGTRTLAVEARADGPGRVFMLSADRTDAPPKIGVGATPRFAFKPGTVKLLVLTPAP